MILSGRDLRWYLETGRLGITPIDESQFQQNGVDLILLDAEPQNQDHVSFWLGCTKETLMVPDDLMAFVELRSTWARQGFLLPPTIVDAGFYGNLTLEILKIGGGRPPIGERFAHLIFAKTTNPCDPYRGKYQGQTGITGAK